jgi:hypothetical protein
MRLLGWLIPWWVYGIAAAVALSGAFGVGWAVNGWRWEAKQAEALRDAQIAFQRQLQKQQDESEAYEQERERGRDESRARETEIRTIYRDRVAPAECEPPADAQRLLQGAVDSANADPGQSGG